MTGQQPDSIEAWWLRYLRSLWTDLEAAMTGRQRVTDEQLTRWERLPWVGVPARVVLGRISALIADLRASRAREADQAAEIADRTAGMEQDVRTIQRLRAERGGLQQRIDKAMAVVNEIEPNPYLQRLPSIGRIRDALAGPPADGPTT